MTICLSSLEEKKKDKALDLEVDTIDKETVEEEESSELVGITEKRTARDTGTQPSDDMLPHDEDHILVIGVV